MRLRTILLSLLGVVLVAAALFWWWTRPLPVLTVATWAGPYARAQANALFRPYGEAKRVDVRLAEYDGGTSELRQQVASHHYDWDVIDLELDDAVSACAQGLLEPIDAASLPKGADGASAPSDFVKGAIGPCFVGSVVYSQVIVWSKARFGTARPQTLADFFDTKRFPGPRALRRSSAKFNLELALLADGVPAGKVYETLSTPEGVSRALAKLSSIRKDIVWLTSTAHVTEKVVDGSIAFAAALNGDAYDALMRDQPLGVIWDRQLYEFDAFGVPKGDPKKDMAMDFVRFATGSEPLAREADWVPYGPARRSALAFVGKNPEFGTKMTPFLPTAPENFATAFAIDDSWWRRHADAIAPRWDAWLGEAP
jgi:putative spermidine/putrescine transport system substrate-binding protein